MSIAGVFDTKENDGQKRVSILGMKPKNGSVPSCHIMEMTSPDERPVDIPSAGHDFSHIPVRTSFPSRRAIAESCPLGSSPTRCPFGGACHTCPTSLQTKLAISQPGDEYEREADRVADIVLGMSVPNEEDEIKCALASNMGISRYRANALEPDEVPPIVQDVLASPGHPLDTYTRAFMEVRFGRDFKEVQVHSDAKADESAKKINARAFTIGKHIVFGSGRYAPITGERQRLVAHELAHVAQEQSVVHQVLRAEEDGQKRCGPELTGWLIDQMNSNQNHPIIKQGREHRWPRYVPFFNIGWTSAALYDFAQLVKPGGPWDFKRNQRWWRAGKQRSCPTSECDCTITLCGHCMNYDVPGNIHFGWVGRRMELAPWILHTGAGIFQEGGAFSDDARDAVAIDIGIAIADKGQGLCDQVDAQLSRLNLDRSAGCGQCAVYSFRSDRVLARQAISNPVSLPPYANNGSYLCVRARSRCCGDRA